MEIEVSMQVFDYRSFVSLPTGDLPQKRCMQQTVIISYTPMISPIPIAISITPLVRCFSYSIITTTIRTDSSTIERVDTVRVVIPLE